IMGKGQSLLKVVDQLVPDTSETGFDRNPFIT
uniref:FHA domain-containing protein n=1 Tax=Parascaris univalens TaxID=6257 RepID=A0A915B2T4_PARUN